ncbi:hypothetical protein AVEN_81260-1 [Araneus ventricosus]|uniref:Uncharacterized protein n=1 Tax=Araneus ventricosus TaxID=182803 RepID=A0A4Y2MZ14_ARAVE|nr:hypothetical protein AVEN_81260-1 [Araneus ventricosus]
MMHFFLIVLKLQVCFVHHHLSFLDIFFFSLQLLTVALLIGASVATHSGHVVKPAAATSYPHLPAPVYSYPPPPTPADLAAAYRLYTLKYGYAPAALPPAPMGYAPVTYAAPLPPAYWPAYAPLPSPAAHAHHFIDQHFDYAHKHAHHHHH